MNSLRTCGIILSTLERCNLIRAFFGDASYPEARILAQDYGWLQQEFEAFEYLLCEARFLIRTDNGRETSEEIWTEEERTTLLDALGNKALARVLSNGLFGDVESTEMDLPNTDLTAIRAISSLDSDYHRHLESRSGLEWLTKSLSDAPIRTWLHPDEIWYSYDQMKTATASGEAQLWADYTLAMVAASKGERVSPVVSVLPWVFYACAAGFIPVAIFIGVLWGALTLLLAFAARIALKRFLTQSIAKTAYDDPKAYDRLITLGAVYLKKRET